MREIPRPVIEPTDPLDEVVSRLARYGSAIVREQKRAIDALPDSRKPADGAKRLTNTSHDKMLARENTIHDLMAANPAKLRELERIFGRRK